MSTGCFPDQALAFHSSTCSLLSCLPHWARFSGACRCGPCTSSRFLSHMLLYCSWCGAHGPGDSFSDRQGWSNITETLYTILPQYKLDLHSCMRLCVWTLYTWNFIYTIIYIFEHDILYPPPVWCMSMFNRLPCRTSLDPKSPWYGFTMIQSTSWLLPTLAGIAWKALENLFASFKQICLDAFHILQRDPAYIQTGIILECADIASGMRSVGIARLGVESKHVWDPWSIAFQATLVAGHPYINPTPFLKFTYTTL